MPKTGPDSEKINRIMQTLKKNPNGLWVREISRQSGLDKSTVSIYLAKYMANEVEDAFSVKGSLIKIVRLKNG